MKRTDADVRRALELAGFEPDGNICRCLHPGGRHTLSNVCLDCGDRFASMNRDETWTHALAVFRRALDS